MNLTYIFTDNNQKNCIIPYDECSLNIKELLDFWQNNIKIIPDTDPITIEASNNNIQIQIFYEANIFVRWLRKLRKEQKITQLELSKLSGVSEQYISQIERGIFAASPKTLESLLNVLLFPKKEQCIELSVPIPSSNIRKKFISADIESLVQTLSNTNDEKVLTLIKDTLTSISALKNSIDKSENDIDELIENIVSRFQQDLQNLK